MTPDSSMVAQVDAKPQTQKGISSLKWLVREWLTSLRKACEKPWKRNGKRIPRWPAVCKSRKHQEVLLSKQTGYLTKVM